MSTSSPGYPQAAEDRRADLAATHDNQAASGGDLFVSLLNGLIEEVQLDRPGSLPPTMKVEEAGQILGLSRTAAYRAAASGDLPTIRLNGRLYVPTVRLLELLGYRVEAPAAIAG